MNRLFLLAAFSATFLHATAQPDKQIASYFQEIRKGKRLPPPFSINDANADKLVSSLIPYLNDSSEVVRSKDILVLKDIGINSKQLATRQKVTSHLVLCMAANDLSRATAYSSLKKFAKEDFDKAAKDSLLNFTDRKYPHKEELIKLIGFAGKPDAIEKIRKFSTSENAVPLRWSTLLALARLGDQEAISSVLQRARKIKVNDEVVTQLFPDLVYTRQKQVIEYLVEVLMSDETNCESADNDNSTSILCGYRVMEQLAPAIKNYPLSLDASGDIKTNDYKKSLEEIRNWFKQGNGSYIIDNTTF